MCASAFDAVELAGTFLQLESESRRKFVILGYLLNIALGAVGMG